MTQARFEFRPISPKLQFLPFFTWGWDSGRISNCICLWHLYRMNKINIVLNYLFRNLINGKYHNFHIRTFSHFSLHINPTCRSNVYTKLIWNVLELYCTMILIKQHICLHFSENCCILPGLWVEKKGNVSIFYIFYKKNNRIPKNSNETWYPAISNNPRYHRYTVNIVLKAFLTSSVL